MFKDKPIRSLVKGVSWRMVGTIDTFFVSWLILGDIRLAAPIALTEVLTKVFLYFLHERLWNIIKWGRKYNKPTHVRSLVKGISWRFVGSTDTILISLFYSGLVLGSFGIGLSEILTKVVLFYLHERLWTVIRWGRIFFQETSEEKKTAA
jgi:uncharacterized membrane protein